MNAFAGSAAILAARLKAGGLPTFDRCAGVPPGRQDGGAPSEELR